MLKETEFKKTGLALLAWGMFWVLLTAFNAFAEDISVSARVNKTDLTLEDSIILSVIVRGAKKSSRPQLPSLTDFRVQSRGTSSSFQIVNGKTTSSITYNYRLTPKNTGTLIIGPVKIELNGKTYSSEPVTLTIREPSTPPSTEDRPVFVEIVVSNEKPYVHEEVTLNILLYRKVNIRNLNLDVNFTNFLKEDLGKARKYAKIINGIEYQVHDLAVALFPQRSGKLEIPQAAVELDLVYREGGRRRNDPFDIFGKDSFFNRRVRTEHKVLRTRKLVLDVQPLPAANRPPDFSKMVGQFNITSELSKTKLEAGDTATLSVKIFGQGNVKDISFNLPELGNNFKVYPDKPEFKRWVQNNRVTGQKIYNFALVPLAEGKTTLPPVSFSYFDPKKNDYVNIMTDPLTLNVLPSKSGEQFMVVEGNSEPASKAKNRVKVLGKDILPIHTRLADFESSEMNALKMTWNTIALLGPPLLFVITALFLRHRERLKHDRAFFRHRIAYKTAREKLDQLSDSPVNDQKNFAGELSQILREYIGN
ncbi:MAG: protein BatD, partial [Nitrospinae bacterium]|nr:protein BatD [Nitrospinota bacterium]